MYLTVQMLFIGAILCQLILGGSPLSQSLFKNVVLRYLGKISYSPYLWNKSSWSRKVLPGVSCESFQLNVAMPVPMAMLSFYFVVTPAPRLKEHFE